MVYWNQFTTLNHTTMEDPKLTPEEELRIENELKALDIDLTYGAHSFIADDAPPELVRMFLDNVANFEATHANAPKVPIRQFAKIPDLLPAAEIPDDDLETHIKNLLEQLEASGVIIDRPEHLKPRGYYIFLTEKFLDEEVTDHSVPGMIMGFSYSDYCHDGPEFIRDHVEETIIDIIFLEKDFEGEWISETCRGQTEALTKAEVVERIHIFRSKYLKIAPIAFQPEGVKKTEVGLYFFFLIAWEGTPVGGGEVERYEGSGVSQVGWKDGEWWVEGIMMPGFEF